jgi:hypothetical protein
LSLPKNLIKPNGKEKQAIERYFNREEDRLVYLKSRGVALAKEREAWEKNERERILNEQREADRMAKESAAAPAAVATGQSAASSPSVSPTATRSPSPAAQGELAGIDPEDLEEEKLYNEMVLDVCAKLDIVRNANGA